MRAVFLFPVLISLIPNLSLLAGEPSPHEPVLTVTGKTQPCPDRRAKIMPAVLHPVEEVKVAVGSQVKKGDVLIVLDADEPKADVRGKQAALAELEAGLARLQAEPREAEQNEVRAALDSCRVCAHEAKFLLGRLEPLHSQGSIAEQRYHEARAAVIKCQADERAAAARLERLLKRPFEHEVSELRARIAVAGAALEAAKAELEHYTLTAPIDGVISRLEVSPGSVIRPGTQEWGEIVDLRVLDVRCEVTPRQADTISVGQVVEAVYTGGKESQFDGTVVSIGVSADETSGLVPVLVRLPQAKGRLRCNVPVLVRFEDRTASAAR